MFAVVFFFVSMNPILILANSIGGLYSFRKEVVKALVDEGYKVIVSCPPEKGVKADYFTSLGCEMVDTAIDRRGTNPLHDLSLVRHYRQLIQSVKPVAVLTYTIKPNIYGGIAARWCGVPQLANITGLGDAIENPGALQKLSIAMYRFGLRKAKRVFFQNQYNRDFCIQHKIATAESVLLPGSGVNLSHHVLQPYPSEGGNIKFLYIGRLLKDKGTEEYFAMAQRVKEKYPDTEFQILGSCEGDYQQQLDKLVQEDIINYLGTTPDVRPFIGAVHCTVMPSYHEGMSNVNLESAANGRPVITTDVPGCQETVDDGVTGYLVKPRSAEDLIEKVERFIQLPHEEKRQMGLAARKKVEREFDRRLVVEAYLVGIDEAVNGKASPCDELQSINIERWTTSE